MTARRFKEKVQKDYVRHVRTFAAFLGRSPDSATSEDLRRFQVHLAQQQIGVPTINAAIAALRFFFNVTLERPDLVRPLTTVHKPRTPPVTGEVGDDQNHGIRRPIPAQREQLAALVEALLREIARSPMPRLGSDRRAAQEQPSRKMGGSNFAQVVSPLEAKLIRVVAGKSRDRSVEAFAR